MSVTANVFIVPEGFKWTALLDGIAASDTISPNGVPFTAEASGATGNQFNVGAADAETAVNFATAINASSDVNTAIKAISAGPWTLALASLANNDIVTLNGNALTAKTSGASGANQFNLGSDHGASELAALINASHLPGIAGTIFATASGTTVTITGALSAFIPPASASHAVCTAASAVVTITQYLTSWAFDVDDGSATLTAIVTPQAPFQVLVNMVNGDAVSYSAIGCLGAISPYNSSNDAASARMGQFSTMVGLPIFIAPSATTVIPGDAVGLATNLGGELLPYSLSVQVTLAGLTVVISDAALFSIQCPDLSSNTPTGPST